MNPYRLTSHALLIAALACLLLLIWRPVGSWWQWLLTAAVLVIAAAGFSNAADEQETP